MKFLKKKKMTNKREDYVCKEFDTKLIVLISPYDLNGFQKRKEAAAGYRFKNLKLGKAGGLYELSLLIPKSKKSNQLINRELDRSSIIQDFELIPIYLGKAEDTRGIQKRMLEYANSGSHLKEELNTFIEMGCYICANILYSHNMQLRSKHPNQRIAEWETSYLKRFDYALNKTNNKSKRFDEIVNKFNIFFFFFIF